MPAFPRLTFSIAECTHLNDYFTSFNSCLMIMRRSVTISVCPLFSIYYSYICGILSTFISFHLSVCYDLFIPFSFERLIVRLNFLKLICVFAADLPGHLGIYFVLHIVSCLGDVSVSVYTDIYLVYYS